MSQVTIYHNPRCSKSRQTLALLQEQGIEPLVVEYLSSPPDAPTLKRLLDLLGLEPRGLMRTKEEVYNTLRLAEENNPDQLITAMLENPILMERPIVVNGERAAIGRPPESVLDIL